MASTPPLNRSGSLWTGPYRPLDTTAALRARAHRGALPKALEAFWTPVGVRLWLWRRAPPSEPWPAGSLGPSTGWASRPWTGLLRRLAAGVTVSPLWLAALVAAAFLVGSLRPEPVRTDPQPEATGAQELKQALLLTRGRADWAAGQALLELPEAEALDQATRLEAKRWIETQRQLDLLWRQAGAYLERGDPARARSLLQRLLGLDPLYREPELRQRLCGIGRQVWGERLAGAGRDPAQALAQSARARSEMDDCPAAVVQELEGLQSLYIQGLQAMELQAWPRAAAFLGRLHRQDPDFAQGQGAAVLVESLLRLGQLELDRGKPLEALQRANAILAIAGEPPATAFELRQKAMQLLLQPRPPAGGQAAEPRPHGPLP